MDDKAIVPVGEPGIPISTGVRGHNKVMAPAEGPALTCTDHDFHIAGLIPSVAFVCDTPEHPEDSFFQGKMFVTIKDKIFQHSTPYRHAVELLKILRKYHSDNDVDLNVPILCLMTDGGPDHRLTYETVKTSLLLLFLQLDLDSLVAIRTAPNNSWVNPAERCMSVLNLALQHSALARDEMNPGFEKMIKHSNSLNAVRDMAQCKQGLREAFLKSMTPVFDIVGKRFERMKLKGEPIEVFYGLKESAIQRLLQIVNEVTRAPKSKVNISATTKELRECKELQVVHVLSFIIFNDFFKESIKS